MITCLFYIIVIARTKKKTFQNKNFFCLVFLLSISFSNANSLSLYQTK